MNVMIHKHPQHHVMQHGGLRHFTAQAFRQMRDNNFQISFAFTNVQAHRAVIENGFFNKEDAPILSAALQQVLRTLIDEIPTQMRKDNQVGFSCPGVWSLIISVHEFPLCKAVVLDKVVGDIFRLIGAISHARRKRMQPESSNLKCDSAGCVSATRFYDLQ